MDRKFVIALSSLAGSVMLTEAHAIGLGDIKLRTALNEPLKADIQLLQVKDLSENEILVNLAPKEAFAKAGVDRDFLLTSLRFRLDLADPKNPRVVVTTEQPMREPYLNFLVEVQWPSGRLLREYTLLMDLPAFADSNGGTARSVKGTHVPVGVAVPKDEGVSEVTDEAPVAEQVPVRRAALEAPVSRAEKTESEPSSSVRVRRATKDEISQYRAAPAEAVAAEPKAAEPVETDVVATKPAAEPVAAEDSSPAVDQSVTEQAAPVTDGSYGPTQSSDTLWKIAQRVRPVSGVSVHQTMVAIQQLNQDAFVAGNINQLKKGQVLKLPSQEEISSIGRAEAVASVDRQVGDWKAKRGQPAAPAGAQLDATGRAAETSATQAVAEGQLTLAAPVDSAVADQGKAAGEAGGEAAALKSELSAGMEEISRVQREHKDMASRATDLDGQIANAERLLELQSSELSALQARLAAEQQAKADAEAKAAADAAVLAQQQAAEQAAAAAQQAAAPAVTEPPAAEVVVAQPVDAAVTAPEVAADAVKPVEIVPETTPVAQPAEVPVPAVAASQSMLSSPVVSGVIGILVILLGLFGYRKMAERRAGESEPDDTEDEYTHAEEAFDASSIGDTAQSDADLADLDLEIAEAEQVAPIAEAAVAVPVQDSGDVLGEADIYISFGNFEKGEALLHSAINSQPQQVEYRLKLLELYKESDNLTAFDVAYKDLIVLDDDVATARAGELRGRISGADTTPVAFGVSSEAMAAGISEDDDLDFDLDLDMDLDAPISEAKTATYEAVTPLSEAKTATYAAITPDDLAADIDLDLDFNFDLDAPASEANTAKNAAVTVDDFAMDFDLDLDLPVAELAAEPVVIESVVIEPVALESVADVSSDDLGLDFDLNIDLDLETAAQPDVLAAAEVTVADSELADAENSMLQAITADAGDIDEDLDFLSDADESATKLDLARAYIDMGDKDGARDILQEVVEEGRSEQKREAQSLLDSIS
jgi:pilus assembly protein FimV